MSATLDNVEHRLSTRYTRFVPQMTAEEYLVLENDIAERGLLQPLEYDADGVLLDGYHRLRALTELGIEVTEDMKVGRADLDTVEKKETPRSRTERQAPPPEP